MVLETLPQRNDTNTTFADLEVASKIETRIRRRRSSKATKPMMMDSPLTERPSKSVKFSEQTPDEVLEAVDYSSVNPSDIWYTRAQLYIVQSETKKCLELLNEADDEVGLERWTKRGARKLQENQQAAMQAVIGDSTQSPQDIASAYAEAGIYTKMVANSRGMKLEREIRQINNNDMENLSLFHDSTNSFSSNTPRKRSSFSRSSFSSVNSDDSFVYRRGSSRCKELLEEMHSALISVRKLGFVAK